MRQVFKFPLYPGESSFGMPGPRIVHVGVDPTGDPDAPCLWIEQGEGEFENVTIRVFGTGHPIDNGWTHVGSTIAESGLVWHVYRSNQDNTDGPVTP